MLQPHSFLWHYLWLGPHVLQAVLAVLLWRRGIHRQFPFFFAYLVYEASEEITLWTMDVVPLSWVSALAWWRAFFAGAAIEELLKLAVIWELLAHFVRPRPAEAKLGKRLISSTGAVLVMLAVLAAHYTPMVHWQLMLISYAHVFLMAAYIVLSGLMLVLFLFAAYRKMTWDWRALGIALGFAIVWCEHLATWSLTAHGLAAGRAYLLDFLNMGTYHVCVLIWFYYLLSPARASAAVANAPAVSKTTGDEHDGTSDWRLRWAWLLSKS
ncbi:MAG: hypothetical protein WCA49_23315 [Candidatus Sulfotelmatobacter sp.]